MACFAYDIFSHWRHQARFRLCKSKVEKIHEAFGKRHENLPLCPICIEALPNVETTKARAERDCSRKSEWKEGPSQNRDSVAVSASSVITRNQFVTFLSRPCMEIQSLQ